VDTFPIEVFATGTWGGRTWTDADLDAMAANFSKLAGHIKPPLKLGHSDKQILGQKDGQPALGWIAGLQRVGSKLMASVQDVPDVLKSLIQKRRYARVSSEIYPKWDMTSWEKNLQSGVTGPVLSAVALLGADIPEVKTLEDLGRLLATEGLTFTECTLAEGAEAVLSGVEGASVPSPPVAGTSLFEGLQDALFVSASSGSGVYGIPSIHQIEATVRRILAETSAHPRTLGVVTEDTTKGSPTMTAEDKAVLLDELKATALAEATALIEAERLKMSEQAKQTDAEIKRLSEENAASRLREQDAARKALRLEAERFAEGHATGKTPRFANPTQTALAGRLFEALASPDVVLTTDEATTLKLSETKDHTARDLFVAFVQAMPSLAPLTQTLSTGGVTKAGGDDPAVILKQVAADHKLNLSNPDERERAIVLMNEQHPNVIPDYRVTH
jgi:hypothetical protein